MVNERDAFYAKLKLQLEETTSKFPSDYMYKFIVPSTGNPSARGSEISSVERGAVITT